ncbi:MAG: DEAD/DEAH box helicase [Prevotella sp.]|nr:DEAD/DEAH box helicase [Prevotella sp.]
MNIDAIISKLGIECLNEMQIETADAVLHTSKDVVVLSPTGSGKTLAYLLPLVSGIISASSHSSEVSSGAVALSGSLSAVVVVPGRELALQSSEVLKSMGSGLRSMALYGGRPTMDEHRELRKVQPHIVFATPGRLNDHLDKGNISPDMVEWLVIDEFDKCLAMGFHDEMGRLVGRLPQVRRRILLSATESEAIPHFVNMGKSICIDHRVEDEQVSERVNIYKVKSPVKDKLETLCNLLLDFGDQSSIVFLNYRDAVERVAFYLKEQGFTVSLFHGGLEQRQREDALYKFANGSANVLVATDLASRGLDIPDIDNIVHYHLPETEDNYVHRVGRTARWDKRGRAFFILNDSETVPEYVDGAIEEYSICLPSDGEEQKKRIPVPKMVTLYIGKGKHDKLSKGDIVGFLCKKGGLRGEEIGRISIEERFTYVAVARVRLESVLWNVRGEKIKGVKTIVEEVR